MWPAIAAIAVASFGAIGGLLQRDKTSGLHRRLKDHIALAETLGANASAKAAIEDLVAKEAEALRDREIDRFNRKLNVPNLVLSIVFALITVGSVFGLGSWTVAWWGKPFGWISIITLVLVGLTLLVVTGAGFAIIFNPPAPKKSK